MGMLVNFDAFGEDEILLAPEGEVQLQLVSVKSASGTSQDGRTWNAWDMRYSVQLNDGNLYDDVYDRVYLPDANDGDRMRAAKGAQKLRAFVRAFGGNVSGEFDPQSIVGNTGWAILRMGEYKEKKRAEVSSYIQGTPF